MAVDIENRLVKKLKWRRHIPDVKDIFTREMLWGGFNRYAYGVIIIEPFKN